MRCWVSESRGAEWIIRSARARAVGRPAVYRNHEPVPGYETDRPGQLILSPDGKTLVAALKRGEVPIFEPGLDDLMARNKEHLSFTTDIAGAEDTAFANFSNLFRVSADPRRD